MSRKAYGVLAAAGLALAGCAGLPQRVQVEIDDKKVRVEHCPPAKAEPADGDAPKR
jgi:starvation-inducible outer membrane lipoprotein